MSKIKYIETPEKMWELFIAYRDEVKSNPFNVTDWVGAKAMEVQRQKEKPLTMEGFEMFCFETGTINDLGDYFSNKNNNYSEYSTICSRIRLSIRKDQIEGGMAGVYNPSITQRLNGLTERTETKQDIKLTGVEVTVVQTGRKQVNSEKDIDDV